MGLKTTNYQVKDLGIVLPNAYALLRDIKVNNDWVTALFVIQSDRENATALKPIETVTITFKFNRNENPIETAYTLVKGKITDYVYNEEKGVHEETEVEMPLYGWEDDILTK